MCVCACRCCALSCCSAFGKRKLTGCSPLCDASLPRMCRTCHRLPQQCFSSYLPIPSSMVFKCCRMTSMRSSALKGSRCKALSQRPPRLQPRT